MIYINIYIHCHLIRSAIHLHCGSTKEQFLAAVSSSSRLVCATPFCSELETPGRHSIMTEVPLKKRDREPESLLDSIDGRETKRLHGEEETDRFLYLLQLDETLVDDDKEEFAPSEELVNEFMKSLEEEIAVTCSTSFSSSESGDNSAISDSYVGQEGETVDSEFGFDLSYLLEASDDDLGIPPSPVPELNVEVCLSTSEGLLESQDLKSLGENWHVEDDFENYQQFPLYEDPWEESQLLQDYMSRDIDSQSMLIDGDFPVSSGLEIAHGL